MTPTAPARPPQPAAPGNAALRSLSSTLLPHSPTHSSRSLTRSTLHSPPSTLTSAAPAPAPRPPSSAVRRPPSALRPPSSVVRRPPSALRPLSAVLPLLLSFLAITGCQTVHRVKVDAISHPAKPSGTSYRLELKQPPTGASPELHARAESEIRSALASRGMHEAPARADPDMVIAAEYGVGPGHIILEYKARDMLGIDFWGKLPPHGGAEAVLVYDKYLKLDAREPPPGGEELWSVHVILEDRTEDLAPCLPALAAVGRDYIGRNSGSETVVKLRGDDPALARPFARTP